MIGKMLRWGGGALLVGFTISQCSDPQTHTAAATAPARAPASLSAASWTPPPPPAWTATAFSDPFGPGEPVARVTFPVALSNTHGGRPRTGEAFIARNRGHVVTGDGFICARFMDNNVDVRWSNKDGRPVVDRWNVSTDRRAVFMSARFRAHLLAATAPVTVETTDTCGERATFTIPLDGRDAALVAARVITAPPAPRPASPARHTEAPLPLPPPFMTEAEAHAADNPPGAAVSPATRIGG